MHGNAERPLGAAQAPAESGKPTVYVETRRKYFEEGRPSL